MSHLTLSVITPNYNHGRYLARAIEAVVTQSRPPAEYLILDDCSTDNSIRIIESYAAKVPYIRVLRNEMNLGPLPSIARLLEHATGDYVYGGASDGYVLPGFFEAAMGMAELHPEAGVLCGKVVTAFSDGRTGILRPCVWDEAVFASPQRFATEFLATETATNSLSAATIYKRAALEDVGRFRSELSFYCDAFATISIALRYGLCYVPQPGACVTVDPASFERELATNPTTFLDVSARAAWLLQSSEFREAIPPMAATEWGTRFREDIVIGYRSQLKRAVDDFLHNYAKSVVERSLTEKIVHRILKTILDLAIRHAETRLRDYRGDISCYERQH